MRDAWSGIFAGIFAGIISPFMLYVARKDLHCSGFLLGLICASPFIGSALTLFYAQTMEGRHKMPFTVWPAAIGRGLFLAALFTKTPLPFALIASGSQLLISVAVPPYAAVMKEVYPDQRRGSLMAYIRVVSTITMLIFTLIGGKLLSTMGYQYLFPLAAMVGVGSALLFGTIRTSLVDRDDPANQRVPMGQFIRETLGILATDRENRWFAIAVSVGGFGNLIILPVLTIFQVDRLHMTESQLAIITIAGTFFWAISYPFWGKVVDHRSPLMAWIVSMIVYSALPLSYFFAKEWWQIIPGNIIASTALGGMELGYFNSIIQYSKEGKETQHQALHLFIQGIRGMIGPFFGASLITICAATGVPARYIFLLSVALMIVGSWLLMIKLERPKLGS